MPFDKYNGLIFVEMFSWGTQGLDQIWIDIPLLIFKWVPFRRTCQKEEWGKYTAFNTLAHEHDGLWRKHHHYLARHAKLKFSNSLKLRPP